MARETWGGLLVQTLCPKVLKDGGVLQHLFSLIRKQVSVLWKTSRLVLNDYRSVILWRSKKDYYHVSERTSKHLDLCGLWLKMTPSHLLQQIDGYLGESSSIVKKEVFMVLSKTTKALFKLIICSIRSLSFHYFFKLWSSNPTNDKSDQQNELFGSPEGFGMLLWPCEGFA